MSPQNMALYVVLHLYFRILKFPLIEAMLVYCKKIIQGMPMMFIVSPHSKHFICSTVSGPHARFVHIPSRPLKWFKIAESPVYTRLTHINSDFLWLITSRIQRVQQIPPWTIKDHQHHIRLPSMVALNHLKPLNSVLLRENEAPTKNLRQDRMYRLSFVIHTSSVWPSQLKRVDGSEVPRRISG